jgi:DNA-binding transcriptional MocR family regulator
MSTTLEKQSDTFLYRQVISLVREMQTDGTIKAGEKLPSLRSMANKMSVSVPTIKQAYFELEHQGIIVARPQSGYYLKSVDSAALSPKKSSLAEQPVSVSRQQLIEQVYRAIHQPNNIPLGVANPVAAKPATKALNRTMRRVLSLAGDKALNYGPMNGYEPLRRQLAIQYLNSGLVVSPDDIVITNGAQEAINIALQTVANPGDIIAVESPCYFGVLELIENLGMLALEIPLDAQQSLCLIDVEKALETHKVKACVFSTSIANPLGCVLSEDKKQKLVELLESRNVPLIEDDVYGALYYTASQGKPAQIYSKKGLVLTCSSFSKTVAPSYRIGWILTTRFSNKTSKIKRALSCSSPLINQWTLCEFIRTGEYERYLNVLRQALMTNKERMISQIFLHFPKETRVTDPQGGTVVWLELGDEMDGNRLFRRALQENISIAPGSLFSPTNRYLHCIRLSYGLPWNDRIESALITLGKLCSKTM